MNTTGNPTSGTPEGHTPDAAGVPDTNVAGAMWKGIAPATQPARPALPARAPRCDLRPEPPDQRHQRPDRAVSEADTCREA